MVMEMQGKELKKTLSMVTTAIFVGLMVVWLASPASAPTLGTVSGTWSNLVGAGATGTFQTVGGENQVLWGVSTGQGQSGLGFTPNPSLPISFPVGQEFEIGTLRHFNRPIFAPAATAVDLTIGLGLTVPPGSPSFTFTLSIQETPNVAPCAFPSATPCADKITFPGAFSTQTFTTSGLTVTLTIVGFRTSPGGPLLADFISNEGQTNSALLFGRITAIIQEVPIDIKPGSFPNSINLKSRVTIPVAILSTSDFDATTVDKTTLTFGKTGNEDSLEKCTKSNEDVNGDGRLDVVCHFRTQDTGFQAGDTEGTLRGKTVDGITIEGRDSVRILHGAAPP